jgi:hypothetical protein
LQDIFALMVGSIVGSLRYAGYEYEKTGTVLGMPPQSQPNAKPTPSLNDIEQAQRYAAFLSSPF